MSIEDTALGQSQIAQKMSKRSTTKAQYNPNRPLITKTEEELENIGNFLRFLDYDWIIIITDEFDCIDYSERSINSRLKTLDIGNHYLRSWLI